MKKSTFLANEVSFSEDLNSGLKWSLTVHIFLFLILLVKSFVSPSQPIPYIPSLRVDLVALPDTLRSKQKHTLAPPIYTTRQEAPELPPHHKQAAKSVKKTFEKPFAKIPKTEITRSKMTTASITASITEGKVEKKNKRALQRLKAFAKIQGQENSPDSDTPLIKGNRLSQGSSIDDEARESAQESYLDLLRDRIHENWELPPWLARQNLSAQVQVFIHSSGNLMKFTFVKSSGNAQFDDAVKQAIQKTQPFPAPPEAIQSALSSDGILVGFPL
jgi:colicin import membrane protein